MIALGLDALGVALSVVAVLTIADRHGWPAGYLAGAGLTACGMAAEVMAPWLDGLAAGPAMWGVVSIVGFFVAQLAGWRQ